MAAASRSMEPLRQCNHSESSPRKVPGRHSITRPACGAGLEIQSRSQSKNSQDAGPGAAVNTAGPCRRSDRMAILATHFQQAISVIASSQASVIASASEAIQSWTGRPGSLRRFTLLAMTVNLAEAWLGATDDLLVITTAQPRQRLRSKLSSLITK